MSEQNLLEEQPVCVLCRFKGARSDEVEVIESEVSSVPEESEEIKRRRAKLLEEIFGKREK